MAAPADPLTDRLRTLYRDTDALFAGWSCAGRGECCRFSITGRQPLLWPIEWRFLRSALRANPPPKGMPAEDCPAFEAASGRCRAYAERPFGCRTHFCNQVCATGKNPRARIRELARRLADLSAADQPRGTLRPLLSWHLAAHRPHRG